jgi:cysteine-rich repeat protein
MPVPALPLATPRHSWLHGPLGWGRRRLPGTWTILMIGLSLFEASCGGDGGSAPPPPVASATCGNGIVEFGEQCDDGNTLSGDGCSATCQVQVGWSCSGSPSTCGIPCVANSSCLSNLCVNGLCRNVPCTMNSNCVSNICLAGICQ